MALQRGLFKYGEKGDGAIVKKAPGKKTWPLVLRGFCLSFVLHLNM